MRLDLPISQFILHDGEQIHFGQKLEDVEKMLVASAVDNPSPVARKGIDKQIKTTDLILEFDSGRLNRIELVGSLHFKNPLTPFPEPWKNLVQIDGARIRYGMPCEEFENYIALWEKRAKLLGASSIAGDMNANQFHFSFTRDQFMHLFHLGMGRSRRAGGGGIWADAWAAFFATDWHEKRGNPFGGLVSLCAFRDEFNSVARRPEWHMNQNNN